MAFEITKFSKFTLPRDGEMFFQCPETISHMVQLNTGKVPYFANFVSGSVKFSLPVFNFLNGWICNPYFTGLKLSPAHINCITLSCLERSKVQIKTVEKEELSKNDKCIAVLRLTGSYEAYLASLKYNIRRQIKIESQKSCVKIHACDEYKLSKFYSLYKKNMIELKSPYQSFEFFINFQKVLGSRLKIAVLCRNNMERMFALVVDGETYRDVLWTSQLKDSDIGFETYKMYNDLIMGSFKNSKKYFSFGRSNYGSGSYDFKRRWKPDFYKISYTLPVLDSRNTSKIRSLLGNPLINEVASRSKIFEKYIA